MDECGREFRHRVGEGVFGLVGDSVCVSESHGGVDVEFGLGVQPVADPPHLHVSYAGNARFCCECRLGGVHQRGVDAVHESAEHIASGGPEDGEDSHGDDQPDDRVGKREAECDSSGTQQHRQRREPVGAGVQPVGNEGRGADAASDPDAIHGDKLIADEADQSGGGDPADVVDRDRIGQATYRFHAGDDRRQRDHRDHEESCNVLGATETVGVAAGCWPDAQRERDPQRDRRERVGEVVDGVGEQCHRSRDDHDHHLGERGRHQRQKADLHRADTGGTGLQGIVDAVGGVVAVRNEQLPDGCGEPPAVIVAVVVVGVVGVVTVFVSGR